MHGPGAKDPMTIPRRELTGIQMAMKLALRIIKALGIHKNQIHLYTDSAIAVAWLKKYNENPLSLKTFVSRLTSNILSEIDLSQIHWVPTKINSADIITKRITTEELFTNSN